MMEPKIRFEGFRGGSSAKGFAEVFDYLPHNSLSRDMLTDEKKSVRNVHYGDVLIKYREVLDVATDEIPFVLDDEAAKQLRRKGVLANGDVVIADAAEDSTVGKCVEIRGLKGEAVVAGLHTIPVRPKEDFAPGFLGFYLNSPAYHQQLLPLMQGTKVSSISKNALEQTTLSFPSLPEQKVLGDWFGGLDGLILAGEKKVGALRRMKAASLQALFPQEGEKTPRVRFKGFKGEWEKTQVGKIGTTYSGLSGKTKEDFGVGNSRYITFLNVLTNARIDTTILEPVRVADGEHQNEVKKGDLLFNTSSETPEEVGMCAVMDEELNKVYLNSFCFGFHVTDENIDSLFIAYLMRSEIGRKIMSILAQGATRYNLSKNNFCQAELLLPKDRAEQKMIADFFANLDNQISLQSQRLEKLRQVKAACLEAMFV